MYADDELLPISALQHLVFCERQCALIHIERAWVENVLTAEGRVMHEKAHEGGVESRGDVRIARAMPLRCARIGLIGVSDIVEFQRTDGSQAARPFPIEYKRGKPKAHDADRVQLCAQALCLEEMFGVTVAAGALYYGVTRRRTDVVFDSTLRSLTEVTTKRLHVLLNAGVSPRAVREPKCDSCSLLPVCLPDALSPMRPASQYMRRALTESLATLADEEARS